MKKTGCQTKNKNKYLKCNSQNSQCIKIYYVPQLKWYAASELVRWQISVIKNKNSSFIQVIDSYAP